MKEIAVIGLGRMGAAIASRLMEMNIPVTVYNRTQSKTRPLVAQGAKAAASMADAVASADVIISCLLDDKAVVETTLGEGGIFNHSQPESIHIGTATIQPKTADLIFNKYKETQLASKDKF